MFDFEPVDFIVLPGINAEAVEWCNANMQHRWHYSASSVKCQSGIGFKIMTLPLAIFHFESHDDSCLFRLKFQ